MTGDLNLDGHNIKNVNNLSATGTISTEGNMYAAGTISAKGTINSNTWINAKNGYGDMISIGGVNSGNDYEIKLSNPKSPLLIYAAGETNDYTTTLKVSRNMTVGQRLGLMGYDPNDLPSGWGGGLRTLDVYAAGTVATGSNGQLTSYMNATGVHTTQNMTAGGNINANQTINAAGNINSSSNISANLNVNVGRYLYIDGRAIPGGGCSPNGAQGRTEAGNIMSCVNGTWKSANGKPQKTFYSYSNYKSSYNYYNIGTHDVCVSIYGNENDQDDTWRGVEQYATDQWRITVKNGSETALCLDW